MMVRYVRRLRVPVWTLCAILAYVKTGVAAQDAASASVKVLPKACYALFPKDADTLAWAAGDLNGDGMTDYAVALQYPQNNPGESGADREVVIIVGKRGGGYAIAARSKKAIYCSNCGGVFGDPFAGISVQKKSFTISHYGGSSWRWSNAFTFGYSKRDSRWQLVSVEEGSFRSDEPDSGTTTVRTPPKDFGLIDFEEFDPEAYAGKGKK
jgi:hypothetical protein